MILKSNHPKAFCAGGDVKAVAARAKEGRKDACEFFFEKYKLDHFIATLRKPLVVIMDGYTSKLLMGALSLTLPPKRLC